MKPNCERCGRDLDPSPVGLICSVECTFCADCSAPGGDVPPHCGGGLAARLTRAAALLEVSPAAGERPPAMHPCG